MFQAEELRLYDDEMLRFWLGWDEDRMDEMQDGKGRLWLVALLSLPFFFFPRSYRHFKFLLIEKDKGDVIFMPRVGWMDEKKKHLT